jgi:hypothetical protein
MIKILGSKKGLTMLSKNYIGRLAFISNGNPHVLPITYYYNQAENTITSYSQVGHKIRAMRKNPQVSLEVDEIESVNNWKSVLAHGVYEELSGSHARQQLHEFTEGVKAIIKKKEHKDLHFISEFSSKLSSGGIPVVYQIKLTEITGREREHIELNTPNLD